MTASSAPRTFNVHVIDGYADIPVMLRRSLASILKPVPVEVRGFETPDRYFNAVAPQDRPDVYVIANRHPGMNGLELANKLREGFTGKIFVYTGGVPPEKTVDVDGVFYKGEDDRKLLRAIAEACRHAVRAN